MAGFGRLLLAFVLCSGTVLAGEPPAVPPEMISALQQDDVAAFAAAVSSRELANLEVQKGIPLIMVLIETGKIRFVEALIEKGADPDVRGLDGITPLLYALGRGKLDIAILLLEKGASPDLQGKEGLSALCFAVEGGETNLVSALLARKASADVRCVDGRTPFLIAVYKNRRALAESLLAAGADIGARDDSGASAMHLAASNMSVEWLEFLASKGLDVNLRDLEDATPLDSLVGPRTPEENPARAWLLNHGARPGAEGSAFRRAYHGILIDDEYFTVKALVQDKDYDVNRRLASGLTLLHLAWSHANRGAAEVLVERGADPGLRTTDGRNGLHLLAEQREKAEAANLVSDLVGRYKQGLNLQDTNGATPVVTAARSCNPRVLEALLRFHPDLGIGDSGGMTAIHHAAQCADFTSNLLEALHKAGADLDAVDGRGRSPVDVAREAGNTRAAELLEGWGARSAGDH